MRVKANDYDLGMVEVLLVDATNWKHLLLGVDLMAQKGLLSSLH